MLTKYFFFNIHPSSHISYYNVVEVKETKIAIDELIERIGKLIEYINSIPCTTSVIENFSILR